MTPLQNMAPSAASRSQTMPNINSGGTGNNGPPTAQTLWPPRTHSRVDSGMLQSAAASLAAPQPSTSVASSVTLVPGTPTKPHISPSKTLPPPSRQYDGKLSLSRDRMHQANLGSSATLAAASSSSLQLPASAIAPPPIAASLSGDNPWGSLHVYVLPLFNGEPLRIPIEDLNSLVRKHIQTVLAMSPSKVLNSLEYDATELIASGMVTLNAKLSGIEENKLMGRVVEVWGFFWDQVLPYIEGVLLPLQTDPLLTSLYRTPKSHRPNRSGSLSSLMLQSTSHIDVRKLVLRAFRDKIILPITPDLLQRLSLPNEDNFLFDPASYQGPRFQQMLLVLISQAHHNPMSLNPSSVQPTLGEAALADLLQAVRSPPSFSNASPASSPPHPPKDLSPTNNGEAQQRPPKSRERPFSTRPRAHSFLSHGIPGDRRGRIASKHSNVVAATFGNGVQEGIEGSGDVQAGAEAEFLESLRALRSPDAEAPDGAATGGWGLDAGVQDERKMDDDEDEAMDWDQAQAVVERMVGMKPSGVAEIAQSETRPRPSRGT